ncbi:MAG: transcriptional regulator, partial [Bacteroidia bacterium]|nr:transcriptional regulator [Bacteroidia bacterium]
MIAVITGDVVHSSRMKPELWLEKLKTAISDVQPDEAYRAIYRGDSFQLELADVKRAFEAVVFIKCHIKQIKGLDIRLAIGIGEKTFEGAKVTESNGPAFRYSGEVLEQLKQRKLNLMIKTKYPEFDEEFNLYFKLILIAMDNWTVNSAEVVKHFMKFPDMRQTDIARL